MTFLPKRACNVMKCETAIALKLTGNAVEPLKFIVPRKSDAFQEDLYPPTFSGVPSQVYTRPSHRSTLRHRPTYIFLRLFPLRPFSGPPGRVRRRRTNGSRAPTCPRSSARSTRPTAARRWPTRSRSRQRPSLSPGRWWRRSWQQPSPAWSSSRKPSPRRASPCPPRRRLAPCAFGFWGCLRSGGRLC